MQLIAQAPKYDGSGIVSAWLRRMEDYLLQNGVPAEDWLGVATWACEKEASHFLGDLPEPPQSFQDFQAVMLTRYGKSLNQALDEFKSLQQRPDTTIRKYADLVRRKSYNTGLREPLIIRKFLRSLANPDIYRHLAAL
jgi:Retrotransposon gag protein